MRAAVKRWVFDALDRAGVADRAVRRHGAAGEVLILNLHSVRPQTNPFDPSLDPADLDALLRWLTARAEVVGLGDLERRADRPRVVLSFDDGLLDFAEHAMPVLARHRLTVNLNVIGSCVDSGEPPWAIRILDRLDRAGPDRVRGLRISGLQPRLAGDDSLACERFAAALTNHLKALPPDRRAPLLDALEDALPDAPPRPMMRAADVAAARSAGHEIGSHSWSHESMEHLDDSAFLADFRRSSEVLGGNVAVYAFPNGSHRPAQAELLQREGVRHVLLVGERASRPGARMHPRITVRGHSRAEQRVRAAGAVRPAPSRT